MKLVNQWRMHQSANISSSSFINGVRLSRGSLWLGIEAHSVFCATVEQANTAFIRSRLGKRNTNFYSHHVVSAINPQCQKPLWVACASKYQLYRVQRLQWNTSLPLLGEVISLKQAEYCRNRPRRFNQELAQQWRLNEGSDWGTHFFF